MKLKMIKRSYSLEWKIALLISLGYCGYFLYGYFKNPEIIHDKSIFIGLAIFVSLFVMSLLGLLLGWEKREAINLDGNTSCMTKINVCFCYIQVWLMVCCLRHYFYL